MISISRTWSRTALTLPSKNSWKSKRSMTNGRKRKGISWSQTETRSTNTKGTQIMSLLPRRTVVMMTTATATAVATIKLKVSHLTRVKNLRSQSTKVAPLLSHQNPLNTGTKGKILSLVLLMHQNYPRTRNRGRTLREVKKSSASLRSSPLWCHSWIGLTKKCQHLWRKKSLPKKRK